MMIPTEDQAVKEVIRILSEVLDQKQAQMLTGRSLGGEDNVGDAQPDAIVTFGNLVFIIEFKKSGKVSSVDRGIRQLENVNQYPEQAVKLLVVPYMHKLGQQRCHEAGISWLDLSGNADIQAPGVRVSIHGKQNLFKSPGRPLNPFAPRGSRVARILLYQPDMSFSQRDLAKITGLGKGYVSHVVRALEKEGLVERLRDRAVKARDPELLLTSWLEAYDFNKHEVIRGHIAARSGTSQLRTLSAALTEHHIEHAATGLAAAWLYTRFASFRLVTVFLHEPIARRDMSEMGVMEQETGANTWLVLPSDGSVFWETTVLDGIPTVHPIQAYLDLKDQPERATDASEELQRIVLGMESK